MYDYISSSLLRSHKPLCRNSDYFWDSVVWAFVWDSVFPSLTFTLRNFFCGASTQKEEYTTMYIYVYMYIPLHLFLLFGINNTVDNTGQVHKNNL